MKITRLIAIASLCLFGIVQMGHAQATQPNAIEKYFRQYLDDARFTVVYISPKLFRMMGKFDLKGKKFSSDNEAAAFLDIAKDISGLYLLITDENVTQYYKEAKTKINPKEYEVLMTVRDKDGDNVEFFIKDEGDIIKELLLLVGGDEFVFMSLVGNISLDKVSRLARSIEGKKQ
jgi:hypothetical protein